jgi:glycosyltransferase involved in cell wall biosynthesis
MLKAASSGLGKNLPHFSVILPVHNQADHIEGIVREHLRLLRSRHLDAEMILVPNACRDKSPQICKRLAKGDARIRVLQSEKGGWGLAVRLGLAKARGQWLCYSNSSRTSSEELLEALLLAQKSSAMVIKARRRVRENWLRVLGSFLFNLECRLLLGSPSWDVNGTPKVFPRHFQELLRLKSDGDLLDAEFLFRCHLAKYPVLEFSIFRSKRHGGRSTTNFRTARGLYLGALQMFLRRREIMG